MVGDKGGSTGNFPVTGTWIYRLPVEIFTGYRYMGITGYRYLDLPVTGTGAYLLPVQGDRYPDVIPSPFRRRYSEK